MLLIPCAATVASAVSGGASPPRPTSRDGSDASDKTLEFGEQPAERQKTSGASPIPELSVAKVKEAFDRAAPDGLLDVGLVDTLMRHFRMNFTVQELEDRVNAVVGNGHLLVFPEFLSLMAGKMTGTEDAFMDAEEADRCSAASSVPHVAAAHAPRSEPRAPQSAVTADVIPVSPPKAGMPRARRDPP